MIGVIYKITNLITKKVYIGQTINSIEYRFKQQGRNTRSSCISNAIKKYGKENFKIESIVRCDSYDELNLREEKLIKLYNTLSPNGYNIMSGGLNFKRTRYPMTGRKHSNLTKNLISEKHKNKKYSEETILKMKVAAKKRQENPITREKIRLKKIGRKILNKKGRKVISDKYKKEFNSITLASKELKISRKTLDRWLSANKNINIIKYGD